MQRVSILIVDDEALLRQGLRAILVQETFVSDIFEASDSQEALALLKTQTVDLILLDIRLKKTSGLELLRKVKKTNPGQRVIAVTGLEGVELIINLLRSGSDGIVYKLDGYKEILKTINAILEGQHYFPERISKIIQSNAKKWDKVPAVLLTFQEMELVKAIANGATTKEIAQQLNWKPATTETYRIRLMKKIGVPNTAALLAYAYRNGIL